MRKVIDIRNLEFHYYRQEKLLNNLNLKLKSGNIHGLIGKNGEGKTTLFKLICGLIFPIKGEIEVLEYEPRKRHTGMLNHVYFLPEEIYPTKLSILNYERVYAPFYPEFSSGSFYKYLNEFSIDTKNTNFEKFSYGQKKKIMIAFGLATNAKLILMDEPTNGLDIPSKRQFRRMISSVSNKDNCIIISTHQVFDLENMVDNIIIMDEHEIIFNELITSITNKLQFKVSKKREKNDLILYQEETAKGVGQILENKTGVESSLDIELLFNALLFDCERIKTVLD
ncbi:MAG: ABC transporter ATP-binding protein [Paludibacter sp.]|nr:ABC transporter ATP-binding protein [Paludibacter sp.]